MPTAAIVAEGLGKRYRLGEHPTGYATLREKIAERGRPTRPSDSSTRDIWALRDVGLEIHEGEVVGIVGRNGAGKSTLLKTAAFITQPTTGSIRVRGRVGALLEVGTGFHPELTGRENVLLNGVILGMSRTEVKRRLDEIVEFAGIERFLDTPLKRYSSGMYLRLAFSVAAHVEPDVVIVDEVLAVGDAEFQRKCLGRMSELGTEGRTVLFVSHDSGVVGRLCRRAVWLEGGRVQDDGPAPDVLARYLGSIRDGSGGAEAPTLPGGVVTDVSLALVDADGRAVGAPRRDETLRLRLRFTVTERVLGLDAAIYLVDSTGSRLVNENVSDQPEAAISGQVGRYEITLEVPPILASGQYIAGLWIGTPHEDFVSAEVLRLTLSPLADDLSQARHGLVRPPVSWYVGTPSPLDHPSP